MIFLNMDPEMVEHEGTQRATNITKLVPPANGQTVGFHTGATSQVVGGSTPDICALRKLNPLRIQDLPSLDPNSSDISSFTPQTPIDVTRLKIELQDFPDQLFVSHLCQELQEGTRIGYTGPRKPRLSKNLPSAYKNAAVVSETLAKEIALGRVAGPFSNPPFPNLQVSPIGVIPKKHSDKFRLIFHLSYPKTGDSINSFISKEGYSLQYTKIDNAIAALLDFGPGTFMAKTDIESAFRIFPIHRDDWELLGMFWENQYFVDLFLPFGLRSAPFKFNNISIAIAWILSHKCLISYVDFILDDFFIMEPKAKLPPHDQNCKVSLQSMLLTLKNLGIPISKHKTEGPSTVLQFLGILLDSVRMEARLPEDKVQRLRSDLSHWRTRKSATLQEIQSLIGTLNFACKVIPPGRPFLQRIIHLTRKVNKPYHHIKLNAGFREDIRMWQTFLDQWNGSNFFMHKDWATSEDLHLYTDAASTVGFGGIFGTQWFQGKWQPNQTISTPSISIDWQELYAVVVTCSIWGKHWSRKRIIFHCDNQTQYVWRLDYLKIRYNA